MRHGKAPALRETTGAWRTGRRVQRKARRLFHFAGRIRYIGAAFLQRGSRAVQIRLAVLLLLAAGAPAYAVDPTGIPECDDLLKRYEGCSSLLPRERIHAAQKELLEGAMSLRANAGNPELRPQLERFCADTLQQMKADSDIKECMSK
jgi:hypothetical protein